MLLSRRDILRLRRLGYRPGEFTVSGPQGFVMLRNRDGWCYFYDREAAKCRVYEHRPVGCSTYPVAYSTDEGLVVDRLCPEHASISQSELEAKGRIVVRHLRSILKEARLGAVRGRGSDV